ncbi:hypothetical protein P154DRAFT_310380 [Amniculicola lignicola CBS 123094]|uniref:Uncharacterized protein n=1 Tax=Amniculicola lignicola CBS 123094 TaxID=1392246 RepID=A0A6A5W3P6_9PLEO|nr:hypothetical protein P154DRAFT_310380 [Amniculicola lignicola CBS 123094]
MTVIWGLDLKEIQWWKFKSSYMWNNEYHLRRTKFTVYQLAMIFCVVSESLGTAALSDYIDEQDDIAKLYPGAHVHNNNFVGAFSYNIFVGVFVATIFGSGFFFDLFWPERHESPSVKLAWKICSILSCIFTLSSALLITIIVATKSAYVTGPNAAAATEYLHRTQHDSPLSYKHNPRGIASVVFIWPGFLATVASTWLLWHSLAHTDLYGPKSQHVRTQGEFGVPVEKRSESEGTGSAAGIPPPSPTHARPSGQHDRNESANNGYVGV